MASSVLLVVGAIDDIVTAPGAARAHNRRLRAAGATSWLLTPVVAHDRAALTFTGRF